MRRRIESFTAQDERPGRETIVLCGSHAAGRATPGSDIDLCYIGDFTGFRRESHRFEGAEFQLMIAPWSWYEDVIRNHERRGNVGTVTAMLAHGVCLAGCSPRWQELQRAARTFYQGGPSEMSQDEMRRIRIRVTDLWGDFADAAAGAQRRWLAMHLIQACVDAHFRIRRWWAVKSKHQLDELASGDPLVAGMVEECLRAPGEDDASLRRLCVHVLEPVGGWMNEPWSRHD